MPGSIVRVTEKPQPEPSDAVASEAEEKPWWDDPSMPWQKKPTRADYACMAWFGVIGVVSLILIPVRAYMMGTAPEWYAMLTGSRSGVAVSGALARVGQLSWWLWMLVAASILSLKFDWIYWWAGKLWGRGMIEVWSGRSERAKKNYARAERWAHKLGPVAFLLAYIPIPLPFMQVVFVLSGATGMSLKRFLCYDYIASTLWLCFYFWLGWSVGEPAVALLEQYAKIAGYVAIGLVVVVVFTTYRRARQEARPGVSQ